MLRIIPSGSAAAAQAYYASGLKKEDYYTQDQEVIGQWHGRAAAMLGLSGGLKDGEFNALTEGRHPVTGKNLTPRHNAEDKRICGWDFNFHCPKSVSVLQAFTGDQKIVEAFRRSVAATMADIEKMVATRVRLDGKNEDRITGSFVWAEFVHFTARPVKGSAPDPHLHLHAWVANLTFDQIEDRFKAAKIRQIKEHAPFFEAAFHAYFAKDLADLGFDIVRTAKRWEIGGLEDKTLLERFSQRTTEIEALAAEKGITDAKAKDELGAKTRGSKRNGMTHAELMEDWNGRLSDGQREKISSTYDRKQPEVPTEAITADQSLAFAEQKLFERNSVVQRSKLVAEALRFGVGHVLPADIEQAMLRRGIIEQAVKGDILCTTPEVMLEEARLIQRVTSGRSKLAPLIPGEVKFVRSFLSEEQRDAVRLILHSNDQVTGLRGIAGAGKTTILQEFREQLANAGIEVFAFAPSTEARDGLREHGYHNAETVARLLADTALQQRVRGKVVVIDEAGQLGIRDLARLMEIAGSASHILLAGDTGQHAPVSRGDPMRLLEDYAELALATVKEIRRQEALGYREAIRALSEGDTKGGFALLEKIGAIVEMRNPAERYQALAGEYLTALQNDGVAPLVVSPTHAEGRAATRAIREQLTEAGLLGEEQRMLQLRPTRWEEAEKQLPENYRAGMVLQFHQNAKGIKRGSIVPIAEVDAERNVWLAMPGGKRQRLDWKETSRFEVFETAIIGIAPGDRIKITRNGNDSNGRRMANGFVSEVKAITKDGSLILANGLELAPDHGHIEHGYTSTSHSSQGKTVRKVFVAQSVESFGAASKEGFYVSCSRGKESIRIFTDDRVELQKAIGNTSKRLSALALLNVNRNVFMTDGVDGVEWTRRLAIERGKAHFHGADHVEKLLAARRVTPEQAGKMDFQGFLEMQKAKMGPDGKSRSKGHGPSESREVAKGKTLPKRVEMNGNLKARFPETEKAVEKNQARLAKENAAKPVKQTRTGQKLETAYQRIKESVISALPEKSLERDGKRSVSIGNLKTTVQSFHSAVGKKLNEMRERRQERDPVPPKKPTPPTPPAPVIRRR